MTRWGAALAVVGAVALVGAAIFGGGAVGPIGAFILAVAIVLGVIWSLVLTGRAGPMPSRPAAWPATPSVQTRRRGGASATLSAHDTHFEAIVGTEPVLPFGLRLGGPGGRLGFDRVEIVGDARGVCCLSDDARRAAAIKLLGKGARFEQGTWRYRFEAPDEATALTVVDHLLDIAHDWLGRLRSGPADDPLLGAAIQDAARSTQDPAFAIRATLALCGRGDARAAALAQATAKLDSRLARAPFEPTRFAVQVARGEGADAERVAAVEVLARRGDGPARMALGRVLAGGSARLRRAALEGLDALSSAPVAALTPALDDEDPEIRALVARVLRHGGAVGRGPLLTLLDDRHPTVTEAAAQSLVAVGGAEVAAAIAARRDNEIDPAVQAALGAALARSRVSPEG